MFLRQRRPIFVAGCVALGLLPSPARAGFTSIITTNTTSIAGQSGYIDFQFNAIPGAELAMATITEFSTDGVLGGCVPASTCITNDVAGTLPTTVTIGNGAIDGNFPNEYTEPITFGTVVQFEITLSGPALDTPGGTADSTFTLDYFTNTANLLSSDPSGDSATLTIDTLGNVSPVTYADSNGNFDTTINIAPEPSSLLLMVAGTGALAVLLRRRRRA